MADVETLFGWAANIAPGYDSSFMRIARGLPDSSAIYKISWSLLEKGYVKNGRVEPRMQSLVSNVTRMAIKRACTHCEDDIFSGCTLSEMSSNDRAIWSSHDDQYVHTLFALSDLIWRSLSRPDNTARIYRLFARIDALDDTSGATFSALAKMVRDGYVSKYGLDRVENYIVKVGKRSGWNHEMVSMLSDRDLVAK